MLYIKYSNNKIKIIHFKNMHTVKHLFGLNILAKVADTLFSHIPITYKISYDRVLVCVAMLFLIYAVWLPGG